MIFIQNSPLQLDKIINEFFLFHIKRKYSIVEKKIEK